MEIYMSRRKKNLLLLFISWQPRLISRAFCTAYFAHNDNKHNYKRKAEAEEIY